MKAEGTVGAPTCYMCILLLVCFNLCTAMIFDDCQNTIACFLCLYMYIFTYMQAFPTTFKVICYVRRNALLLLVFSCREAAFAHPLAARSCKGEKQSVYSIVSLCMRRIFWHFCRFCSPKGVLRYGLEKSFKEFWDTLCIARTYRATMSPSRKYLTHTDALD
jgi:hypothetical protein